MWHSGYALMGILPVKLRSSHEEVICYSLLDNWSGTTLSRSDELALLNLKEPGEPLTIKAVSETAKVNAVSRAFQEKPVDETESKNIETAVVVGELPILLRATTVS